MSDAQSEVREFRRLRLQKLVDQVSNGSMADFANKIAKSPSYVSRMLSPPEKEQAKPIGEKIIRDICSALNINKNWFENTDDEIAVSTNDPAPYKIDVLDIQASAGFGVINGDVTEVISSIEYTETQYHLMFNGIPSDCIKVIHSAGDSMIPTIEPGDALFIDISKQYFTGDGIYVFSYKSTCHVKRLQMAGDEMLVLSDNKNNYQTWRITEENEHNLRIWGRVLIGQTQAFKRFA